MASISSCFTVTPRSHSSLVFSPTSSTLFKPTSQFHSFRPIASFLLKNNPLLPPPSSKVRYGNRVSLLVPSFVVNARIDVNPTAIRPGGAVESDKLPVDVRRRAMDAVDGCGGRVTIGDVASKAGLKLNEAQKALQALAADTDGFLEVFQFDNSKFGCIVVYELDLDYCNWVLKIFIVWVMKIIRIEGMVPIGDVASKAGLKLHETQKALQAHAANTDGFSEVFQFEIVGLPFNSSKAGLKLNEAQKALQALTADTDGCLEVFQFGNSSFGVVIVYSRAYRGIDLQDISEISLLSREIGESYDFDFLKHGFDLVLFLAFYYSNQMSWYRMKVMFSMYFQKIIGQSLQRSLSG
ncbi:iron-sulfur cluster biosynthesis family protein [Actinidia rufa]|uniref:Iron-sulfur cluster biosynthesis family protein n=1 Tax=Actinidia rufa TaxID=165716 RepID=A0A7J0F9W4_9ERIC|nr:iron-sulfur cluster biosynthesis family protein [Actinidia rufa]